MSRFASRLFPDRIRPSGPTKLQSSFERIFDDVDGVTGDVGGGVDVDARHRLDGSERELLLGGDGVGGDAGCAQLLERLRVRS